MLTHSIMQYSVTDQLGRTITLQQRPVRIVSTVPSQTELLSDLGLNAEVVGITKFCIHPVEWFNNKIRIGGTKALNLEKIKALQPDLIIANKEENDQEQIELLAREYPVYISDIKTLDDAVKMIQDIGILTGRIQEATQIAHGIRQGMSMLTIPTKRTRCAYFIWWEPLMSINHDTFIHDMLTRCGFENVFSNETSSRYPVINEDALLAAQAELILLPSEPFPFGEKHIAYFRQILPQATIMKVDGEMFSWYGSRLLRAPNYLRSIVRQASLAHPSS